MDSFEPGSIIIWPIFIASLFTLFEYVKNKKERGNIKNLKEGDRILCFPKNPMIATFILRDGNFVVISLDNSQKITIEENSIIKIINDKT